MNEDRNSGLEELLDAYFDDRLSVDQRKSLACRLLASESNRAAFWRRAELEESLEGWGRRKRGEATALAESGRPRRRWTAATGWAAAAVLTAAWMIQSRTGPQPVDTMDVVDAKSSAAVRVPGRSRVAPVGSPVAYLSRVTGVESQTRYRSGELVGAGEEVMIEEGLIEIFFYSGARVAVAGPAHVVPHGDLEVEVRKGRVQVDVPESAIGFRMLLPDGVVTDFGTSFDVAVDGQGGSRVQVLEGEVELAANGGKGEVRRITAGQAMGPVGDGELGELDFSPLRIGESLGEKAESEALDQMRSWERYGEALDADESVVVRFSLPAEEWGKRVIRNQAGGGEGPRSGTVISADWSEGRWPGKAALAFRRPADRVRVDVHGRFPEATFVAWVRIDGLPRQYNGLFFSEHGLEGEAHWQISKDGEYWFGVRPEGVTTATRFHRAFSEPVISSWEFGSWRMLASTFSAAGREVVHYVDGEEVSRIETDHSIPLQFGRATVGNFFDPIPEKHAEGRGMGEEWSFRNWTGALDEFILFSRVLPADELRVLYEAGRVD